MHFLYQVAFVCDKDIYGQRHAKRDLQTLQLVQIQNNPYTILIKAIRIPIAYTTSNICDIDVTSVKKCRPWSDAASETQRLVWVYTFCTCPKVPFRMTLAIYEFSNLSHRMTHWQHFDSAPDKIHYFNLHWHCFSSTKSYVWNLLESSLRDDSNKWSNIEFS